MPAKTNNSLLDPDYITRSQRLPHLALIVLAMAAIFFVFLLGKPVYGDSKWAIPAALSLISERNYDLNEFGSALEKNHYKDTVAVDGKIYPLPSAGISLLAVPFVLVDSHIVDLRAQIAAGGNTGVEHFTAAFYVMLTALFVYLISRRLLNDKTLAWLLVFIFAFCTSAWSTASASLFQHGPSMLLLSISLFILLKAEEKEPLSQYVALPLVFAFAVRPSNIVPLLLLSVFIALQYRRFFLRYLLWAALVIVPFLVFNLSSYGGLMPPYYESSSTQTDYAVGHLLTGLAGNLVSPSRGLLIFSPVLIFGFAGIFLKLGKRSFARLDYFLLATLAVHWMMISLYDPWWGGHSYGPRYFTDMLPLMIYFMIPAMNWISGLRMNAKVAVFPVLLLLTGVSFFAQLQGTENDPSREWNVHPEIFGNQWRLWDWSDIPYLRRDFADRSEDGRPVQGAREPGAPTEVWVPADNN